MLKDLMVAWDIGEMYAFLPCRLGHNSGACSGMGAYRTQMCSRQLVCYLLLATRISCLYAGHTFPLCVAQHGSNAYSRDANGVTSSHQSKIGSSEGVCSSQVITRYR